MVFVMTKREKFAEVMSSLRDLNLTIQHLYPITGGKKGTASFHILDKMTDEQSKSYKNLSELYFNREDNYNPIASNSEKYRIALEEALKLYEDMLMDWVGEPISFSHNRGGYKTISLFIKERFELKLSAKEWDENEFGSDFYTEFNGHKIQKLSIVRGEDGYSKNHIYGSVMCLDREWFPEEISLMGRGLYTIDEFRFDVRHDEIEIYAKDEPNHPLIKYMNETTTEKNDYEPECSYCGDGGCIHCEPWRFI
jgi:hypothetical protein